MNIQLINALRNTIAQNLSVFAIKSDSVQPASILAVIGDDGVVIDTLASYVSERGLPTRFVVLAQPVNNRIAGVDRQVYAINPTLSDFLADNDFDPLNFTQLTDTNFQALLDEVGAEQSDVPNVDLLEELLGALMGIGRRESVGRVQNPLTAILSGIERAEREADAELEESQHPLAELFQMLNGLGGVEGEFFGDEDDVEIDWDEPVFNAYGEVKVSSRSDDDETGTRMVSFKTPYGKVKYPVCAETGTPVLAGFDSDALAVTNGCDCCGECDLDEDSDELTDNMEAFSVNDADLPEGLKAALSEILGKEGEIGQVIVTGGALSPQVKSMIEGTFGADKVRFTA